MVSNSLGIRELGRERRRKEKVKRKRKASRKRKEIIKVEEDLLS
jgi:hypothetical protein